MLKPFVGLFRWKAQRDFALGLRVPFFFARPRRDFTKTAGKILKVVQAHVHFFPSTSAAVEVTNAN
ncbi:hypothetical protein EG19_06345 [Thermoanaerobaculum aquaticum]|uniref:Uncharacterized protein n=1 Tax=Thermoanaerobaculum aquaticum TaxID=1312852 RepID=A0A062XZ34_9BACT|nr:hypothetical protein EG19_06345 [Thermoanaerobaculum aquaticum]